MNILQFLAANWDSVLVVLAFAAVVVILIRKGQTVIVNRMLLALVTEAEKQFGNGTGELKYSAVTGWLYEKLPTIVRLLFTPKQIDKMIEEAVEKMKEYLQSNQKANTLVECAQMQNMWSIEIPAVPDSGTK